MVLKYACLNAIAKIGLERFGDGFEKIDNVDEADAILVRSQKMNDMEFSPKLEAIARAGAGVNNIPVDRCSEKGIVVFNTPGANANAVKELVLAGMLLAARDIAGGINWVKENVSNADIAQETESHKKAFSGTEIAGKKLGIIGLGAIGLKVANAAVNLDMEVYGYDPYISVGAAWQLSTDVKPCNNLEALLSTCDFISIHVPLSDNTKGLIGKAAIEKMKQNAVLLNFSRDILVDEDALISALEHGKIKYYVTDFPNPKIVGHEKVVAIPHLGASTEEAEENCAVMAVEQLKDYMENGNICNSVNYPDCDMGVPKSACRMAIAHRNKQNVIAKFTTVCGDADINILELISKSKGDYAYTILDVDRAITDEVYNSLKNSKDVLKIRILTQA